jgi:pimeloyl-ACP methyl ester carboxylesterase
MTPFAQHDVDVHGMRIRYIDVGPTDRDAAAAPPLLLLHGHTSRIEEYDDFVPHLAKTHRVIVPDLPGCGYSDKPNRAYSLQLYEDTVLGFLDELDVRECRIAGGSLGGNLTLRLGHRIPDRFPMLAAWAPAGAWHPTRWLADAGKTIGRATGRLLFWPFVWVQSRYWYEARWPKRNEMLRDQFAYFREVMSPAFARMYFEVAFDQFMHSHYAYAKQISQPTLLAWGDRDHGLNMGEGVKKLATMIPNSELRVFAGARHSLANEIPEELGRACAEFFARGPRRADDPASSSKPSDAPPLPRAA